MSKTKTPANKKTWANGGRAPLPNRNGVSATALHSETSEKYKAIKYIRLSDADENPGESDSVANQRRIIDEFLKNHPEIEVVGEKIDDGWTGILFNRPAFNEMMKEFEEGRANCCVTKDLSRLGREFGETLSHIRRIFPAYGVRFIAINDNIDTLNDSGDDLTVSVKSLVNDEYCRDISKKTRTALAAKRANGEYVGACPVYGYIKSEENHNLLVIDEYSSEIVRCIFRMRVDGLSAARIAATLNEKGILSPYQYKKARGLPHPKNGFADKEDSKWSPSTIIRILKDETYTGVLVQGISGTPNYKIKEIVIKPTDEWKRTENAHDAIIPKAVYDLTQKIMQLDTRTAPDDDKVHIFSGILICGCCGGRMTRKTVPYKENKHHYYYCRTTKKRGCDGSVMLKEDDLKECVLYSIKSHIENIASLEKIIDNLDADRMARELAKSLTLQLNENERRIGKNREFTATLYQSLVKGDLTKTEHKSIKVQYIEEAEILAAENERLKREIDDALLCKNERMEWIAHFKQFENLDALDRKTVINMIQCIKVKSKTELEIVFNYNAEYKAILEIIKGGIA